MLATLVWWRRIRRLESALRRERQALGLWREQGSKWRRRAAHRRKAEAAAVSSRWFESAAPDDEGITVPSALHKP